MVRVGRVFLVILEVRLMIIRRVLPYRLVVMIAGLFPPFPNPCADSTLFYVWELLKESVNFLDKLGKPLLL